MKRTLIQLSVVFAAVVTGGAGCLSAGSPESAPAAISSAGDLSEPPAAGVIPPVPVIADWQVTAFERYGFRLWYPPAYRAVPVATTTPAGEPDPQLRLDLIGSGTVVRFARYDSRDPFYVRYNPFINDTDDAAAFIREEDNVLHAERVLMGPVNGLWYEKRVGVRAREYNFLFTQNGGLYRFWTTAAAVDAPAVSDLKDIVRQLEFITPTGLDF